MSDINPSSMLAVGTVLNGNYRIERHLSSGGFGNTYMATNLIFNDVVAVKEFFMRGISLRDGDSATISVSNPENQELFTRQLEKFKKEAQRIRQLRSQHIVRVHDLFEANGTAYYVMDYIDGESLAARLKRTNTPLTEAEAMKYLEQVLDALDTIHGADLCHMDLKPNNIMVDKDDNAILIDFGASKRIYNERFAWTMSGVNYTNGYAPPEQLEQNTAHFGPWTDIYALGATLYKLLTNRKPPLPSTINTDISPDKHEALPFPDGVSQQMRNIILKMMAVRWTERPQSIAALRTMMEQSAYGVHAQMRDNTTYGTEDDTQLESPQSAYDNGGTQARPSLYENESKSQKWLYAVAGVLAALIVTMVIYLLTTTKNGPVNFVEESAASTARPLLKDSTYWYEGDWNSPNHDAQPCRMEFDKRGNILSNCKYINLKYNETVPLEGTIDGDTLRFSNVSDKHNLRINLAMPTVLNGNLVGYGIDYKHSGLRAPLNLHVVAQKTSVVNSQEQDRQARYNAYVAKLNEYAKRVRNEDRFEASYFLHDMTGDGNPELCVFAGVTSLMDFPGDEFSIYFYTLSQGKIKYIGKYDDGSCGMADSDYYKGNGYILNVLDMQLFKISYYNGNITYTLKNSDYCDTPKERKIIFLELSDRSALSQISG